MLTQRGIIDSNTTMDSNSPIPPHLAVLLGEVRPQLRILRQRLESGAARWSTPLVEVRIPATEWRWDVEDFEGLMETGDWREWFTSPTAIALLETTEWLVEREVPWDTDPRGRRMVVEVAGDEAPHLVVRQPALERYPWPKVSHEWRHHFETMPSFHLAGTHTTLLSCPFGPHDVPEGGTIPLIEARTTGPWFRDPSTEGPPLRFDVGGHRGEVFVGVGPLRLSSEWNRDTDQSKPFAFWTLAVGLVWDDAESATKTPPGDELWSHIEEVLVEAGAHPLADSPASGDVLETPSPGATRRLLSLVPTRISEPAQNLLHALRHKPLPVDSSAMRDWGDIQADEVERLQKEEGDRAFQEVSGVRKPLLRVKTSKGKKTVELTAEARKPLRDREGELGFVELRDRGSRPCLVKRYTQGTRSVEVALSLNGDGRLLSKEFVERLKKRILQDIEEEKDLLPGFGGESRVDQRRARLDFLQSMEDARELLHLLVVKYGANPNPDRRVRFQLWEAWALLEISETDKWRVKRVRDALSALVRLEYDVGIRGTKRDAGVRGVVVGAFKWDGSTSLEKGSIGNPRIDPDTWVEVEFTDWSLQALAAYWVSGKEADSTRWVESNTLAPYTEKAANLNPRQAHLAEFIRANITRNLDASAKGEPSKGDSEPRRYTNAWCPLLPDGEWVGVLGRFKNNPETGFKVASGERGLGRRLGYTKTRTTPAVVAEVLADLERWVGVLGGVVVGKGRWSTEGWLTFDTIKTLDPMEAGKVALFVFLPLDWASRESRLVEEHHRRRLQAGETTVEIGVVEGPAPATPSQRDPEFIAEVRRLRRLRGVSQLALAKVVGVDRSHLAHWEGGRKRLPEEAVARLVDWVEEDPDSTP